MRVAFAVGEAAPWCMTGGLGDVAGALPQSLQNLDADVAVFIPLYREVKRKVAAQNARLVDTGARSTVWIHGHKVVGRFFRIDHAAQLPAPIEEMPLGDDGLPVPTHARTSVRVPVFAFDCPIFFDRDGLYGHADDAVRFSAFSRAVLNCATELMNGQPDVIHSHDWHTALIPMFLAGPYRPLLPKTAAVLTIHNLAYQGVIGPEDLGAIGVGAEHFHAERLEFYGRVNMLKGGIACADAVTTVSPRYADEIRTAEFGERLDGVLRAHSWRLSGIVNGIDVDVWNPAKDNLIAAPYSADNLAGKALCRRALLQAAHLDPDDPHPVFGVVSRFTRQKGLDLIADLVPGLESRSVRLLMLGQGEPALEARFTQLGQQFPNHVRVRFAHEPGLAHMLQAGVDAFLMPSRYEPCGLSQLYAMRYGTIPIVRAVGGLRDTVVEATRSTLAHGTATGFRFEHDSVAGLQWAIDSALDVFYTDQPTWRQLQHNGMTQDFSWSHSARQYLQVYRDAITRRRRHKG